MVLEQNVAITASRGNIRVLKAAGITDYVIGDTYEISFDRLSPYSHCVVNVQCDYCGKVFCVKLSDRNTQLKRSLIKKDCCKDCQPQKASEQCQLQHGVDWPTKRPEVQEKWKHTVIEKYGVENVSQSQAIKDKKAATFTERYGEPYYLSTEEGRIKAYQTFVENFGTDPYNNPSLKERRRKTCMGKYGVPNSAQAESVRNKIRQTLVDRYGVENPMGVDEFAEKARLNRYGSSGSVASKPQMTMYNNLIALGYDAKLEYRVPWGWFDVAVFLSSGEKVDFEYDGIYWHGSEEAIERDRKRDEKSFNDGWKVVRFRGSELPPSKDEIQDALTTLIDNNQQFYTVELAG